MRILYFPYTFVPGPVAEALSAFFRRLEVLRPAGGSPSEVPAGPGPPAIEAFTPAGGDEPLIAAALSAYRSWARERRGSDLASLAAGGDEVPFFGAASVERIRTEIRKRMEGSGGSRGPAAEALLRDRVFLALAEDFDRETAALRAGWARLGAEEAALLALIGGEGAQAPGGSWGPLPPEEAGAFMIAERISAWARLAAADPSLKGPLLLLTPSREAAEIALERAGGGKWAFRAEAGMPGPGEEASREAFRSALEARIRALLEEGPMAGPEPQPAAAGPSPRAALLEAALFPGLGPSELLARLAAGTPRPDAPAEPGGSLLALLSLPAPPP